MPQDDLGIYEKEEEKAKKDDEKHKQFLADFRETFDSRKGSKVFNDLLALFGVFAAPANEFDSGRMSAGLDLIKLMEEARGQRVAITFK